MPWLIGVDEAGYGPNLGPFVMTAAACRVPEGLEARELWPTLKKAVRRRSARADGRLLIDDSKLVYGTAAGLGALELGVLAVHAPADLSGLELDGLLAAVCPASRPALHDECWYTGRTPLPACAKLAVLTEAVASFHECCRQAGIEWAALRSTVVLPEQFNYLVDKWGTKGAVLGHALAELLRDQPGDQDDAEPMEIMIDKHGGRNHYAAMLQEAIPEGTVVAMEEGMECSSYRVVGGRRPLTLTFQPRADGEHLCVALASMVSKYVRELLMLEFNRYWQERVPGLQPTAGYPGDAKRFFESIRPAVAKLGIAERVLWRCK